MSKTNYEAIARIIRESKDKIEITNRLTDYFAGENPRFDAERFKRACNDAE